MNFKPKTVRACRLACIGVFISFDGWCLEKLARFVINGENADRGFLTLPLCPIYGIGIIAAYLFCGTPTKLGGIIGSKIRQTHLWQATVRNKKYRKYIFYFLFVTLVSTLAELITGSVFKLFGVMLWDYSERALNLWGIICPSFSLLWGIAITLFMGLLWERLYRLFLKIPNRTVIRLTFLTLIAIAVDFSVNLVLLLVKRL